MPKLDDLDAVIAGTALDPLDAAISSVTAAQDDQRRGSLLQSVDTNPEEYAEAKRIGKVLSLPPSVTAGSLPGLRRRTKLDEIDAIIRDAPATARALQNRDFAGVAHDEVAGLRQAEQAANFKPTITGADVSMLIDDAMKANPALDWDTARANVLRKYNVDNSSTGLLRVPKGPALTPESFVNGLIVSTKNMLPKLKQSARLQFAGNVGLPEMEADALRRYEQLVSEESFARPDFESSSRQGVYGPVERDRGDTARYAYGGVQNVLTNVPGLALAVLTRNPYVALAPAVGQTELDQYARTRTRGGSVAEANVAGVLSGVVEGATELYPMKFLVDSIGRKTLMQLVVGDQLREQFGEQIATHMQDAIDTAIANPNKTWKEYFSERRDASMQTVVAVLMQSAVVATYGATANSLAGKSTASIKADQHAQSLLKLMEIAEASKVRARDPESFQQFVASVAEDGPVQEVWVSPNTLAQAGVDVRTIAAVSPSFAAQLDDAVKTGGEVRIPVAEFATALPGTGLEQAILPHLRTDADGMTQAEAQVFMQTQAEEFQREAETILAEQEDAKAWEASASVVEEGIFSQLATANRFTADVNREYAKLARAVFTSAANRLGVTPEEAYKQFALRVQAQSLQNAQYDQSGQLKTETPEFKAWFGDSKVVDTEGKPLVVYRGDHPGKTSFTGKEDNSVILQGSIFFSDRPTVGKFYTKHRTNYLLSPDKLGEQDGLYRVYLSLRNPLVVDARGESWMTVPAPQEFAKKAAYDGTIQIDDLAQLAKAKGYDGLIVKDVLDQAGDGSQYVAFSPTQIKSVFNEGTFNPDDANILKQSAFESATVEAQALVDQHTPELIEEYFTRFGNVIDPDNVKTLFPAYAADHSLAAAVHEPSSQLAKAIFTEALRRNRGAPVVFTAGGGGSGKSETMSIAQDLLGGVGENGLIYDSTLSSFESASRRIDEALASGSEVDTVYTNREGAHPYRHFRPTHLAVTMSEVLSRWDS